MDGKLCGRQVVGTLSDFCQVRYVGGFLLPFSYIGQRPFTSFSIQNIAPSTQDWRQHWVYCEGIELSIKTSPTPDNVPCYLTWQQQASHVGHALLLEKGHYHSPTKVSINLGEKLSYRKHNVISMQTYGNHFEGFSAILRCIRLLINFA